MEIFYYVLFLFGLDSSVSVWTSQGLLHKGLGVHKMWGIYRLDETSYQEELCSTESVLGQTYRGQLRFCSCCRNVVTDALDDLVVSSDDSDEDKVSDVPNKPYRPIGLHNVTFPWRYEKGVEFVPVLD